MGYGFNWTMGTYFLSMWKWAKSNYFLSISFWQLPLLLFVWDEFCFILYFNHSFVALGGILLSLTFIFWSPLWPCQATNISIWVFGMNNQSNHQTNWLHFRHFQLKKYLAVGGGGGSGGGGGVGGQAKIH